MCRLGFDSGSLTVVAGTVHFPLELPNPAADSLDL